jgi:hypothetical protein
MTKRIFIGAILGAIIAFIWGNISWVVMDWHMQTLHQFKDEATVVKVIKDNAPVSGVYIIPRMPSAFSAKPGEDKRTLKAQHDARVTEGPRAFVAVTVGPGDPAMKKQIAQYFLTYLGYAFILSILLACCAGGNYIGRVFYVGFLGLLMASYSEFLGVTWFNFSWEYALLNSLDGLIGWTLAGLVMAAVVRKPRASSH